MAELGGVIGRLAVHLNLETAAFEKGTKRATKEMSTFEKNMQRTSSAVKTAFVGMLGAFAVDQLVNAAKDALDYAGSLGEVAKQLGVSTDALQSFRYIASQVGVEQDEMDKGLAKLTRTIGEAVTGSGKAAELFDRLGISVRDSTGQVKSAEAILPEIANAYNRLGSEAEKSALSAEVFGAKLGQKLNPALELGAQGIADMVREANELGLVLSKEMIDNADTASDTLTTLSNVMKLQFTAAVAANAKEVAYLASQLVELLNTLGKVTRAYRGFANIRETEGMWEALTTDFSELGNYATREDYVTSYYGKNPRKFKPDTSMPKPDPRYSGVGISRKTPFSIAPKTQWPTTRAMGTNAFGGGFGDFAPGQGEGFIRMAAAANDLVKPLGLADALFENMATVNAPRLLATVKELTPAAEQMRGVTQSILDRLYPEEAEMRRYKEELAALNASLKAGELSTTDYARAVNDLRQEFNGFAQAIRENAEIVATGIGPTMDDLLDQADASWERFSIGLIDQSARTRDQVVSNYLSLAAGVGDALGQLIGGKTGRIIGGIFHLIGAAAPLFGGARAAGGPVTGGRAYLVGEKGPELMVPGMSGMVIPNHAMPQLVAPPAGSRVAPNGTGGTTTVHIVPTPYFDAVVDGRADRRVSMAAPNIATAAASGVQSNIRRSQARTIA